MIIDNLARAKRRCLTSAVAQQVLYTPLSFECVLSVGRLSTSWRSYFFVFHSVVICTQQVVFTPLSINFPVEPQSHTRHDSTTNFMNPAGGAHAAVNDNSTAAQGPPFAPGILALLLLNQYQISGSVRPAFQYAVLL